MTVRSLLAGSGAVVLAAGLVWAITAPATAAPSRFTSICEVRLCLVVLDPASDRDGDGVTDIDEERAGTDPFDPHSYPGAPALLDLALTGQLPSFERHLTEIVALPKKTPDGNALATALGAFAMPTKAWLFNNPGEALDRIYANGFTGVTDVLARVARPTTTVGNGMAPWGPEGGVMLIGAGDPVERLVGPTNWSHNGMGDKPVSITGGATNSEGGRIPEFEYHTDEHTGRQSNTHTYTVDYAGGGHDEVDSFSWQTGGGTTTSTMIKSFDAAGNLIGETKVTAERTKDRKTGVVTNTFTVESNSYSGGKRTGSARLIITVVIKGGIKTTTTTGSNFDAAGNEYPLEPVVTEESVETKDHDPPAEPKEDGEDKDHGDEPDHGGEDGDHGYYNPDYVSVGPITAEDEAKVRARLDSTRTPGPDTGDVIAIQGQPRKDPIPLVALINPDGVVSIAVGTTPTFNRAMPDYDPHLVELAQRAGVGIPQHDGNGPISWPDNP